MTRYFAGGNTAEGFCPRFAEILPERARKRVIYLKGGPGVGKSSLMRRVGAAYEAAGRAVEYYHCSSDPESLDGIAVPELGFAMMDGTAPHLCDPVLPVARDELISLADLLDEAPLRQKASEIARLTTEISALFRRAYGFLSAAGSVRDAACQATLKQEASARLCNELTEQFLPLRGGYGDSRELFGEAYTPNGFVSLLETLPADRRVALPLPFGASADEPLRELARRARSRGLDAVLLLDPLHPRRLAHLAIPAHGLLFTTAETDAATERIPAERLFDGAEPKERGFDRNAFELLALRAVEQIRQAKGLHDELESHYTRAMDFARWERVAQRLCEEATSSVDV